MKRRDAIQSLGLGLSSALLSGAVINPIESKPEHVLEVPDTFKPFQLDKPITAITLGAGARGNVYGNYAVEYPDQINIIAVAEPNPIRNERYARKHAIEENKRFDTWEQVFTKPKFADAIILTTPDDLHYAPCMKALELGYDVLLEKPIAQSIEECEKIAVLAAQTGRIVAVCHVLRYAPYFVKMREIIQSGEIGDIVSVQHLEAIEHIHMSHSYVRGNWHNSKESTPIILAKSCHDLDILNWMLGKPCQRVMAMGQLSHFTAANKPANAAKRCLDCPVEKECVFSAKRIYLDNRSWLYVMDLPEDPAAHEAFILEQLRTSNYGRCVYDMENDQPDHFISNLQYQEGVTVAFSMEAFTSYGNRHTRIMGTKGDIVGNMVNMTVTDYLTRKQIVWDAQSIIELEEYKHMGHGGGDWRLMKDFIQAVANQDPSYLVSTVAESLESHIIGYKAEESRIYGKVVNI